MLFQAAMSSGTPIFECSPFVQIVVGGVVLLFAVMFVLMAMSAFHPSNNK